MKTIIKEIIIVILIMSCIVFGVLTYLNYMPYDTNYIINTYGLENILEYTNEHIISYSDSKKMTTMETPEQSLYGCKLTIIENKTMLDTLALRKYFIENYDGVVPKSDIKGIIEDRGEDITITFIYFDKVAIFIQGENMAYDEVIRPIVNSMSNNF